MNYADLVIVLVAVLIVSASIIYNVQKRRKAKKAGTMDCSGCTGCSGKNSSCKY